MSMKKDPLAEIENPLALDQQVCFGLAVAARSVIGLYRPLLEPLGLTHPQYLVMLALWEEEPLRVSELGRKVQLDPGTLSPLLKRLEAQGYVRRERNKSDERSLAVVLTNQGRALRDDAEKIPPAIVERLDMNVDDLMELHRRLLEVIAAATREPAKEA
ncbi:MarR family winged helix-turn-helix transcriptional regulator [Nocardioides albus]|uniref:DNA-binding MarR family transcriptional regulator n=1 Tax=Nocardioides albus TaxID=1841 RepID=A0A7W5A340_9ACTN|nr:MarR family transcriptional regulator [Nocardioides albus]MBB3088609.1 DNA-binding MarR family transcriptional regulator [Nocardioides albus]GGU17486.1 MarR family transcriptional regulator [Nocardioides albus]